MEKNSFYMKHVCDSNLVEFPCPCRICKRTISSSEFYRLECYTCDRQDKIDDGDCSFIIHKSCTETTPRHIQHHPFHPQHDLALSSGHDVSTEDICNACGDDLKMGFVYKCTSSASQCSFALDFKCAFLTLTNKSNTSIESGRADDHDRGGDLLLPPHRHRLFSCNKGENFSYSCTCCKLPFEYDLDTLLVCLECKALLHKSCAEIPRNIEEHPFHPSHPLVLLTQAQYLGPRFKCNLCRQEKQDGFAYHCPKCGIFLDVRCASLKPKMNNGDDDDVPQLRHFHPLIVCEDEENTFPRTCYACGACGDRFRNGDEMYFCHECECLLDKSCADHLELDMEHVLHPEHELTFWYRPLLDGHRKCGACLSTIGDRGYQCFKCAFYLDIKCAMSHHTVIPSPIHHKVRNLLVLHQKADRKQHCTVCLERCHTPFYHSLARDFVIHVQCMNMLPTKIKSTHRHPLILTEYSPADDIPYDEQHFKCDACKERREVGDQYYCCNECGYTAHPHCVVVDKTTFQDFKKSFTRAETKEVDSVLQAYKEMDKPNWLYYSHTATTDIEMASQKLRMPWEYWDAKSKVIEIKTGIWILKDFVSLLNALFRKYGDFCSGSNLRPYPKMLFVTTVCEVLHNMSITNVTDITKDMLLTWFQGFALGKHAGLDMAFAFDRLLRVATAHFGLHASLFIDPNFAEVGDGEVAKRRTLFLDAEESEECTINVGDSLISLGKFKLHDEIKELGKDREELEDIPKEKRSMYEWKKEWLTDTLELMRAEKAFVVNSDDVQQRLCAQVSHM